VASSSEIESTTQAVIAEFCSYGLMFTALDVSNEVKTRISGVRHREVSPVVRTLFEADAMGGDYVRSLIDVTVQAGKTVQAYLYHDQGRDPGDYGQRQREQRAAAPDSSGSAPSLSSGSSSSSNPAPSAATPPPAPARVGATTSSDDGSSEIVVGLASDGSATLPRSFVERAGLRGDEIALDSAGFGSGLVLSEADEDAEDPPLEVLEYEASGQLRIPASYLGAFDPKVGLRARIELDTIKLDAP